MIQDVRAEWLVCGTRNLLMWQADVVAAAAEKSESSAQKGVSRGPWVEAESGAFSCACALHNRRQIKRPVQSRSAALFGQQF